MTVKHYLSNDPERLEEKLQEFDFYGTSEAEYGSVLVEGSNTEMTLAHHGERSNNPAPCLAENRTGRKPEAIGYSHVDLDAIGGAMALMGVKPDKTPFHDEFWKLAAFVDTNGPHKLSEFDAKEIDEYGSTTIDALNAWWAAITTPNYRPLPPRDGGVLDISETTHGCMIMITFLLPTQDNRGDFSTPEIVYYHDLLINKGREWKENAEKNKKETLVDSKNGVLLRVGDQFVNAWYDYPDGVAKAIVGYNPKTNNVTLSFEDGGDEEVFNARKIVQKLFGPKAGGHVGIAGGPRGKSSLYDAKKLFKAVSRLAERQRQREE